MLPTYVQTKVAAIETEWLRRSSLHRQRRRAELELMPAPGRQMLPETAIELAKLKEATKTALQDQEDFRPSIAAAARLLPGLLGIQPVTSRTRSAHR